MVLHVKPTANKDQVFRLKSNFIRYLRDFDKAKDPISKMAEGLDACGDGAIESIQNISTEVDLIRKKHSAACAKEIKLLLYSAAKELGIPIF